MGIINDLTIKMVNFFIRSMPYFSLFLLFCVIILLRKNKKLVKDLNDLYSNLYKECEFCKDYNSDLFKDNYIELARKHGLVKLHLIYVLGISAFIVILFLTINLQDANRFGEQLAFASTISSIILSIIAIFMSISSESKAETLRREVQKVSENLLETVTDITQASNEIRENTDKMHNFQEIMNKILGETKVLKEEIGTMHESVDRQEKYLKQSKDVKVDRSEENDWANDKKDILKYSNKELGD